MYKISDFSKKTGVSIQTLRYYDQIGLLQPSYIDFYTGYRYYEDDQTYLLEQINQLKEIKLSLEEIKHYMKTKDITIIIEKKKGLEEQMKKINQILEQKSKYIFYTIEESDYKKYVEINGLKQARCAQALEVRDHNASYFIIEKDHSFYDDFVVYKDMNWLTLDVKKLEDETLRKQLLETLSNQYDFVTMFPKSDVELEILKELFSNLSITKTSQTGYDGTKRNYNRVTIHLNKK